MKKKHFFLSMFLLFAFSNNIFSQNLNTFETFGKNRIQTKKFQWRYISTTNFDVYYYAHGSKVAQNSIRFLENEFVKITETVGYTPDNKFKVFIYNSISDLRQSNVGIEQESIHSSGQTDFFKPQIEIPFAGSEEEFKKELRFGIASMLLRKMMFGNNFKNILQNSYTGKFNDWFLIGAAKYIAEGWSLEMDDYMRDMCRNNKIKRPYLLKGKDALLAGQSVWNYIAEKYGNANISSILNLARLVGNERSSIGGTLGISFNTFMREWEDYYLAENVDVLTAGKMPENMTLLTGKNRNNKVYHNIKVSPNGDKIAYSENSRGKYTVYIQDLKTQRRKSIVTFGKKALIQRFDETLPLIAWRDNDNLGIMHNQKNELRLSIYNTKGRRTSQKLFNNFNQAHSIDFSDDGSAIAISADKKGSDAKSGQNDLFIYNLNSGNLAQITDDWFDDVEPAFLPNSNSKLVFSSNRPEDTLVVASPTAFGNLTQDFKNFDIFLYENKKNSVKRLTNNPQPEREPVFFDNQTLVYLTEENGISQLKKYNIKTNETSLLTNYAQNIRSYDLNPNENGLAFLMLDKGRIQPYYAKNLDFNTKANSLPFTLRVQTLQARRGSYTSVEPKEIPKIGFTDTTQKSTKKLLPDEVDTDNYVFDEELLKKVKENKENKEKENKETKENKSLLDIAKNTKKNETQVRGAFDYRPIFRNESLVTTIKVDPLRNWGVLVELNSADLLENHRIKGGIFALVDLRSRDYYLEYQYLAKRFDIGLRYERRGIYINQSTAPPFVIQRYTANKWNAFINYALNENTRISVQPFYMNTLFTSLDNPSIYDHRIHYGGVRGELIFDNTIVTGQNMIAGTRLKLYGEYNHTISTNDAFKRQTGIQETNVLNFSKIGADLRHYQVLHKDLILAIRVAYGRFGGRNPKSFMLGGMDNWVFNTRENPENSPLQVANNVDNSDLLFNEFVTNMRGYNYNRVFGENFLLTNIELRIPLFKYLFGNRLTSNFLRTFQATAFYDMGSAWTGLSPFNRDNSLNTRIVGNNNAPFRATVNDFKSPWLVGYGLGVRTLVFGYYLKGDFAWAVEDYVVKSSPNFYLTFGYDF